MQAPTMRLGAIISIVGSLIIIGGFFLPLFTIMGGSLPPTLSEIQITSCPLLHPTPTYCPPSVSLSDLLLRLTLLLPFLIALLVLVINSVAVFRGLDTGTIIVQRVLAIVGLVLQLILSALFLLVAVFAAALTDGLPAMYTINIGFVLPLIGFVAAVIGVFLVKSGSAEMQRV